MTQLTNALAQKIIKTKRWRAPELKLLGAGVNGRVYNIGGGRAMKLLQGTSQKEYLAMNRLKGTKFVPKVRKGSFYKNTSSKVSAFLMNKLPDDSITLKKFHEKYGAHSDPSEKVKIGNAIKAMHSRGISHGDLHTGNIMVTHTGGKINRMWIIDFGRSVRIPKGASEKNVYAILPKVTGYNRIYGTLYGNKNAPSRPNLKLQPHAVVNKKTIKSKRMIVKKVFKLDPRNKSVYTKSAAFTAI